MRITRILVLVAAAVLCAAVWNLAAPRERKLAWVGSYSPEAGSGATGRGDAGTRASQRSAASQSSTRGRGEATKSPGETPSTPPGTTAFLPHPDRASVEIGADAVEQLHRQGVLFLDARRSSVYKDGHIPGARSFPVWESDIDARVKAFFEEGRDQRAPIVIYCSGGDCEDSHMLSEKLYFVGFDNALIYKDGFPDWQKRGGAVSKGNQP